MSLQSFDTNFTPEKSNHLRSLRLPSAEHYADSSLEVVPRNRTGDATHAMYIAAQMDEAAYKHRFTKGFVDSHALLGSLTGRRMTFNNGSKGMAGNSAENQILEQFYGHAAGMRHYLGSDKPERKRTKLFDFGGDKNIMGSDGE